MRLKKKLNLDKKKKRKNTFSFFLLNTWTKLRSYIKVCLHWKEPEDKLSSCKAKKRSVIFKYICNETSDNLWIARYSLTHLSAVVCKFEAVPVN